MDAVQTANRGDASANPIRIDTSQIPAVEVQILSATVLKSVQAFYENPENQRRFEEWLNQRNGGKTIDRSQSYRRNPRPA